MATASLHLLGGEEVVFLPYYFNPQGFYFSSDNQLLVEHFRASLKFLAQQWDKEGQPLMPLLIRESMLLGNEKSAVYALLHEVQRGKCDSISIKTGSLRQLLNTAAITRIDNLQGFEFENNHIVDHKEDLQICTQSNEINDPLTAEEIHQIENKDDDALIEILVAKNNRLVQAYSLILLLQHK